MARWYTSDHHFGHRNIIDYCDRPFAGTDEMNDAMVERWNDLLGDDDEVWLIGDVALGDLHAMLIEHVARLRGRKILVPGNHDRCWAGSRKHLNSGGLYLEVGGFERIVDAPKPVRIGREKVRISHFPYLLDESCDLKYLGELHWWLRVIGHDGRSWYEATTSGGAQYGNTAERVGARLPSDAPACAFEPYTLGSRRENDLVLPMTRARIV